MYRKSKSTLSSKKNAKDNPPNCWAHFPLVVAEVVDGSVSNMKAKKAEDKLKKETMKTAIQNILQNGTPIQNAVERYGLCRSTLTKYYRIAKNKLDECFGEEADVEFVLKEHDGGALTCAQLLAILKKQTVANSRKRKGSTSDYANSVVPFDGPQNAPLGQHSPPSPKKVVASVTPSNSFMVEEILSSQPLGWKEKHPLMVDQQRNSQMLLTRRFEPAPFVGTEKDLISAFAQVLGQYYHGDFVQLAAVMANFVRYEYELRWQKSMFGIPQYLIESAYLVLARNFQLNALRLTDVDERLAEMDVNVGGTSNNWLGQ